MGAERIAQRVFNTPLLIDPAKAAAIAVGLGPRLLDWPVEVDPNAGRPVARFARSRASVLAGQSAGHPAVSGQRSYALHDGVAVVNVYGTLVHRGAWLEGTSGVTSYEAIAAQVAAAVADPEVRAIALEIDSHGGEVAGAFDLADAIRRAREVKPVRAFVAEAGLSAAYALASQADSIVLPRTGEVGSIGAVLLHADLSAALAQDGIRVTLIHAGAHKTDANPYEPLAPSVRARLEEQLAQTRELFAATVAAGRGNRLGRAAALATEAAVFRGEDAVAAGLADEVADPREAFGRFAAGLDRRATWKPAGRMRGAAKERGMKMQTEDIVEDPAIADVVPDPDEASLPVDAAPQDARATVTTRQAAEIARICAQAARLGVALDAAALIEAGADPEALRAEILDRLAAQSDASAVVAVAPAARHGAGQPVGTVAAGESPLLVRVRRAVDMQTRR